MSSKSAEEAAERVDQIAWIDVETTGLVLPDHPMPLVLEVAMVLTTPDLEELVNYTSVVAVNKTELGDLDIHPIVQEMHEVNGLWNALHAGLGKPIETVEEDLIRILNANPARRVIWGGSSPASLDRPVLLQAMPQFYKRIHYRTLDVTTLKIAFQSWAGISAVDDSVTAHRALPDTYQSIGFAQRYRSQIKTLAKTAACELPF